MNYQLFETNNEANCAQLTTVSLFNRLDWVKRFEQHICDQNFSPATLVFSQHNKEFFLPLAISQVHGMKTLNSLTNYYSPNFKMTGNQVVSNQDHVAAMLAAKPEIEKFDVIDFFPLYQNDAMVWQQALEATGFSAAVYPYSVNWYHDNIKDLDHYWSLRPSILRNTLKRKQRKLEQLGGYQIKIVAPKSLQSLKKHLAHYHHVYYESWKIIEPFPAFIDAIVIDAWKKDELRLGLIYHQEVPVAAQIWFVSNGTAYIFKLAYRTSYRKTSVGTVLTAALIEQVIAVDRVSSIDFLTGDDNYKKDWMQSQRNLYRMIGCNKQTVHGNLQRARHHFSTLKTRLHGNKSTC